MDEVLSGISAFWVETPWWVVAWVQLVVTAAFFVRGFAGFGASMIGVAGLALVLPPALVVPVIFALEIGASLSLLPKVWRDVDWRSIAPLVLGCLVGTPVGIALLSTLPDVPVRVAVSLVIIGAAFALERAGAKSGAQDAPKVPPGRPVALATGVASGLLNGLAGVGGPPAVLFWFSGAHAAHVGRASVIAYFLFTDVIALSMAGAGGLVDPRLAGLLTMALPAMGLGIWMGSRRFVKTDPATFRRLVLRLLMALGTAGLLRALLGG